MSLLQSLGSVPPLPQQGPAGETQGMPSPARAESRAKPGFGNNPRPLSKAPGFGNNPRPLSPSKDGKPGDDPLEFVPANLVKTPYGRVHSYVEKSVPNADAFNKFAFNAVEDEKTAREDGASLDKTMSGENTVSAFVAKHLKSFEAEVSTEPLGQREGDCARHGAATAGHRRHDHQLPAHCS